MYVVLYGPSGSRKSTAIRHAVRLLLHRAIPETPILPQAFSMESLISRLARDSADRGKGSGLIVSDELSDLIGGPEYKAGNTKFLTDIWDCPTTWMRETQTHAQEVIENAYVSLLAASAPDWMETIDPSVLAGGFLRRVLFVVEYGPKGEYPRPIIDRALLLALSKVMRERIGPDAFGGVEMRLTDEAHDLMAKWYSNTVQPVIKQGSEREGQFASCMQAHALKLGALVSVLEGGAPDTLGAFGIEVGQQLVDAIRPGIFNAYRALVPTAHARLRAAIMRMVKAAHGKIEGTTLITKITDSHGVDSKEFNRALSSLMRDKRLALNGTEVRAT